MKNKMGLCSQKCKQKLDIVLFLLYYPCYTSDTCFCLFHIAHVSPILYIVAATLAFKSSTFFLFTVAVML